MRRHDQPALADLRHAIDSLPARTREAMLEGIASNLVITGDYMTNDGGICPMLAAHREGARANFVVFADAWDRFTGVHGLNICRRATPRELQTLAAQLEQSLCEEAPQSDLAVAIAEHRALSDTRHRHEAVPSLSLGLAAAITEHQALARGRREREASDVGLDWLRGGDIAPPAAPVERETRRRTPVPA